MEASAAQRGGRHATIRQHADATTGSVTRSPFLAAHTAAVSARRAWTTCPTGRGARTCRRTAPKAGRRANGGPLEVGRLGSDRATDTALDYAYAWACVCLRACACTHARDRACEWVRMHARGRWVCAGGCVIESIPELALALHAPSMPPFTECMPVRTRSRSNIPRRAPSREDVPVPARPRYHTASLNSLSGACRVTDRRAPPGAGPCRCWCQR
jgi:hypothetical protein